jgi:hypothetical protein
VTRKLAIRSATILLAMLNFWVGPGVTQSQEKPKVRSSITIGHNPPLRVFASVLPQIKAKSHIPVLLPSELPSPISTAKYAVIAGPEADKYAVTLFYERQSEAAYFGFAAFFSAEGKPDFKPQELPNVEPVDLAHHLHGFFRAVSCGGSCAPANLWWEEDAVLYVIQLGLSPSTDERDQEKTIVAVVNSAILAGPR